MLLPSSIGVSISPSRVAMMGLRQTPGSVRPVARETFALDSDQPVSSQIEAINRGLDTFISRNRLETASRFLAAPLPSAMWRRITLPIAARENLPDTIRYEAEKYLPIPLEELYWDYQLIEENRAEGTLTVLLAIAKRTDMTPFVEFAGNLPGGLSGVEPGTSAIANGFNRHAGSMSEAAYGLVVLTSDQIHLVHMQDGVFQGGRTYNRPDNVADLMAAIRKGLSLLRLGDSDNQAAEAFPVHVCVEDSREDLPSQLQEAFPAYAWHTAAWGGNDLPEPDMMAAYGLALKGLQKPATSTNLLPLHLRKQPSRLGQYLMVALVALTLVSGIAWGGSTLLQKRFYHARLDREINRLADDVAGIERLQADAQEIRDKLQFLQGQKQGSQNVLDIFKALTEIIPDSAWVREITIEPNGIRLDGYADAAAELIPLIDASPFFTDVSFLSAITKGRDGKEKFRIGFKLAQPDR
ncbi:MAG: pilus assembly protein PilM [Desulfobacteraceae bacterium]|nr:pilus assembly protein PilM [Desulfobacteraceae bacterium]MBC2750029.1 PilN domain-containing protein [Desulfobacteraceae bacterium]